MPPNKNPKRPKKNPTRPERSPKSADGDWERAARRFLAPWQARRAFAGALACGSYVTGHPTPHSDVDLQILLAPGTRWRERGNRIVGGFLVEYFANPPEQLRAYFADDHRRNRRVTATMFCTGRVLADPAGDLARMVREARRWHRKPLPRTTRAWREHTLYAIWDVIDNAMDAAERGAPDLAFQYHHAVYALYEDYARFLRQPVLQVYRLEGVYGPGGRPEKILAEPFPDPAFVRLLMGALRESDPKRMPARLRRLAGHVTRAMGGFEIDGWRLRTPVE